MGRYEYDTELRDARREANRFAMWGIGWWIIVILVALAIGAGIWGLTVALSGVKGQGDGVIQKNSSQNWLDAQARFEENYQEYESTLVRIDVFHEAHLADPDDAIAKTNWLGSISHCTDVVADYNADARNFLREDFRASDLPESLDPDACTATQIQE
jgi:hypothetical protein